MEKPFYLKTEDNKLFKVFEVTLIGKNNQIEVFRSFHKGSIDHLKKTKRKKRQ